MSLLPWLTCGRALPTQRLPTCPARSLLRQLTTSSLISPFVRAPSLSPQFFNPVLPLPTTPSPPPPILANLRRFLPTRPGTLSPTRTTQGLRFFAPSSSLAGRALAGTYFSPRAFSTSSITSAATADAASSFPPTAPVQDASNPASPDAAPTQPPLQPLSSRGVAYWLLALSFLSVSIISLGGLTRLTESGLSITEWRPVTGTLPPLSEAEWEREFEKYRATPEFKMLNSQITLDSFKNIYYMEYSHRLLGRFIGLFLLPPFLYLYIRRRLHPGLPSKLLGLSALLAVQGGLGWWMVASGLRDEILTTPGAVPRVSQYRLAAHLGAALLFYSGLFLTGLSILRDNAYLSGRGWRANGGWEKTWSSFPRELRNFRLSVYAVGALVFVTALSGAFVAGLDAGLIYNEFPLMGGRLIPPGEELVRPEFSDVRIKHTRSVPVAVPFEGAEGREEGRKMEKVVTVEEKHQPWRNLFENPTTVQFDHRLLACTTYVAVGALHLLAISPRYRKALPRPAQRLAAWAFMVVNLQVALGISTLLYLVPTELAVMHQAGSVGLLTVMLALGAVLRRPGKWARVWREAVKRGRAV